MCVSARDSRDNQRDAVFFLMMPLLTALPSALLTARSWIDTASTFFDSIACRAFLIKVLSFDFMSMLRARRFRLC